VLTVALTGFFTIKIKGFLEEMDAVAFISLMENETAESLAALPHSKR
jgi:hypothetical protein